MKCFLTIGLIAIYNLLFAQIDKKWVVGYLPSILQFDEDTAINYSLDTTPIIYIMQTTANVCDSDGNLLFFSNGMCLFDKHCDTIENAYDFHPPKMGAFYEPCANSTQAALILPRKNGTYYYFHYTMSDSAYDNNASFDLLYYSIVDMQFNNGKGKLVSKNNNLLNGTQIAPYGLTACRHANGRDWWLIMPEVIKNAYHVFLVTPDTVLPMGYQLVSSGFFGTITPHGQCAFSTNGNYLAATNFDGGVKVMQFDRCSGIISPWLTVYIPLDLPNQTSRGGCGVAFSESARFLYVNSFKKVHQFDLADTNVQQSRVLVGQEDSGSYAMFDPMQIGPNGKIYVSNFNGHSNCLNTIQNPEEKGVQCNFVYRSDTIRGSLAVIGVPNMPNYSLGVLHGSGCDTLISSLPPNPQSGLKNIIQISPNPACDVVKITIADNREQLQLVIYNSVGQVAKQTVISGYLLLDVSDLPNGIYHIIAGGDTGKLYKARFVVAR